MRQNFLRNKNFHYHFTYKTFKLCSAFLVVSTTYRAATSHSLGHDICAAELAHCTGDEQLISVMRRPRLGRKCWEVASEAVRYREMQEIVGQQVSAENSGLALSPPPALDRQHDPVWRIFPFVCKLLVTSRQREQRLTSSMIQGMFRTCRQVVIQWR